MQPLSLDLDSKENRQSGRCIDSNCRPLKKLQIMHASNDQDCDNKCLLWSLEDEGAEDIDHNKVACEFSLEDKFCTIYSKSGSSVVGDGDTTFTCWI